MVIKSPPATEDTARTYINTSQSIVEKHNSNSIEPLAEHSVNYRQAKYWNVALSCQAIYLVCLTVGITKNQTYMYMYARRICFYMEAKNPRFPMSLRK